MAFGIHSGFGASLLYVEDKDFFKQLEGNISVRSTNAKFSKIAFDQKHEQVNKEIKSRNGFINLVNNEDKTFLRKLELCSGEIHEFLDRVEKKEVKTNHKEESETFRKAYNKNCNQVYKMMKVNPFICTPSFKK